MDKLEFLNKELKYGYDNLSEVNWFYISRYKKLSEDFIREFQNEVNWINISVYQKLSENFIREFKGKVDWVAISTYQILSEDFIRKFKNKVDWYYVSEYQKLSEDFIRELKSEINKGNWAQISEHQKLSEDFIREFNHKVDWYWISKYQILSEDFIREFQHKVDWYMIIRYQKLSKIFIKEFNLEKNKDNWLYKTKKFKKEQIIKCGLYECYDDYFIAYKSVKRDRHSFYNFQYQYLKGGIYECHCDCMDEENIFGLSVWTNEKAKNYSRRGLILQVKVKYEDVGRLVHNSNKIRCSKIEILD